MGTAAQPYFKAYGLPIGIHSYLKLGGKWQILDLQLVSSLVYFTAISPLPSNM